MTASKERLEAIAEWRKNNPDKVRTNQNNYYRRQAADPEKRAKLNARAAEWRKNNRAKCIEAVKKHREKNKERYLEQDRDRNCRKNYGIGLKEREAMLEAQGFKCAACGGTDPKSTRGWGWHVDHCHNTGKVRGILCQNCNTSLGMAGDSIDRLKQLIAYLEIHSE